MATIYLCFAPSANRSYKENPMPSEFSGIERRLDELNERLARLQALQSKPRAEFDADPYLRDIAERNLEIAAQCVLDICHRIIVLENARNPRIIMMQS